MKCANCGNDFSRCVMVEGVKKRLGGSRKYCLTCSPAGLHNTKSLEKARDYKCKCGENDKSKFYGKKKERCSACHNADVIKRARDNKIYVTDKLGGKCSACGYDKCIQALEVHHLDPATKDVNFRHIRSWSKKKIDREIENCVLLCANCHREHHAKDIEIS